MSGDAPSSVDAAKAALRHRLLTARRARPPAVREEAAAAIAAHLLALAPVARARTVAAYRALPDEPDLEAALTTLVARGAEVLLPLTRADGALDWARHDPGAPIRRSDLGVREPIGPPLGPQAVTVADVVIVPALAVDHAGRRLGRGAGYYDRTLGLLPPAARPVLVAVVHAEELLTAVPHAAHDVAVDLVVTESGVFRVPGA